MERLVSLFLRLIDDKNSGVEVWASIKKFEEISREYEFDSAGENIADLNVLVSVKLNQFEVFEVITDLLCEKVEDKENSLKLAKILQECEQMEMLQWCIVNYSVTWINTNGIQRLGWRIANSLFL